MHTWVRSSAAARNGKVFCAFLFFFLFNERLVTPSGVSSFCMHIVAFIVSLLFFFYSKEGFIYIII